MTGPGDATASLPGTTGDAGLAAGAEIGTYRIAAPLGEGGMGQVVRAEHTVLGRTVALKVMRPEIAADRQYAQRFLREARAAAAVLHHNLVAIHDAGEVGGRLFLVFEFVPGGDLDAALARRGTFPPDTALELIAGCADGLQALHEAGLVHRDIKPNNIFLDARGRPKLGDFGLARSAGGTDRLTVTGAGMGTPAYMAPEQAAGDPQLDIRADIHALGGTLYTLLTRRPPFDGPNAWAVVNAVINDPPPDPRRLRADLPAEVAAIVLRAMAKRREDRFATPAELAAACRAARDRLRGVAASGAALAAPATGGFLGPFAGGGWRWLGATAAGLLALPLALAPLCALHPAWRGPGYAQPGLWGWWLGMSALAAALLWTPLRLARGEAAGRGAHLGVVALVGVAVAALVWCAAAAVLEAAEAGRGWWSAAAIASTAAGLAWLGRWLPAAWRRDADALAAGLTRALQLAIPLLVAALIGLLVAAQRAGDDAFLSRIAARHAEAESAWAVAAALPVALVLLPPLLRLRRVLRPGRGAAGAAGRSAPG